MTVLESEAPVSANESAPRITKEAPSGAQCHFCSEVFDGPAKFFLRGRHEKDKHNEEWLKAKAGGAKKRTTAKKAAPKPKTPSTSSASRSTTKRISAAESIGTWLGRVAKFLGGADDAVSPLARALEFSAPATGAAADELIAGTFVDRRIVQPFAGIADKWDRLEGIIAFPVLVAIVSHKPNLLPMFEGELRDAALDVVIASVPTLEKKKARERKAFDALSRLGQVDERYAQTDDPIGLVLQDIFGIVATEPRDQSPQ